MFQFSKPVSPPKSVEEFGLFIPKSGDSVPPLKWFEYTVGMNEDAFRHPTNLAKALCDIDYTTKSGRKIKVKGLKKLGTSTSKVTQCGVLEFPTLHSLLPSYPLSSVTSSRLVPIEIRTNHGSLLNIRSADVATLQADPRNCHALFQVASNFNGVEAISSKSSPDAPNFVTNYCFDRTQGPRASIGCPAAAIYRVLYPLSQFSPSGESNYDATQPEKWKQTKDLQLNILDKVKEYFPVRNGYVCLTGDEPQIPSPNSEEFESLVDSCSVMIHRHTEVVFTGEDYYADASDNPRSNYNTVLPSKTKKQVVDQVFCAALNIGQETSGITNRHSKDIANKVRFCQRVAYKGTYLAALAGQNPALFLTLIGCGVFDNDPKVTLDTIVDVHKQLGAKSDANHLKRVVIPFFSSYSEPLAEYLAKKCEENGIPYIWNHYEGESLKPKLKRSSGYFTDVQAD